MKIALLGTRGIPNNYGGFEKCAEELALFLRDKDIDVYVYSQKSHKYKRDKWNDISLIHISDYSKIPIISSILYDLLCIIDARKRRFDVVIQLGYSPSGLFSWLLKNRSIPMITNMAGIEWRRSKWGSFARFVIKLSERMAIKNSTMIISDNIGIKEYIDKKYGIQSVYIPYGAYVPKEIRKDPLLKYKLKENSYCLVIARLQSDNNVEMIIRGFLMAKIGMPLLIIGSINDRYSEKLRDRYSMNSNIRFVGGNYDQEELLTLRRYSFAYFHGHSAGGTNPSLLEAMAAEARIIAYDNVFNRSVLDNCAIFFRNENELAKAILNVDALYDKSWISRGKIRISNYYQWNDIGMQYYDLINKLIER